MKKKEDVNKLIGRIYKIIKNLPEEIDLNFFNEIIEENETLKNENEFFEQRLENVKSKYVKSNERYKELIKYSRTIKDKKDKLFIENIKLKEDKNNIESQQNIFLHLIKKYNKRITDLNNENKIIKNKFNDEIKKERLHNDNLKKENEELNKNIKLLNNEFCDYKKSKIIELESEEQTEEESELISNEEESDEEESEEESEEEIYKGNKNTVKMTKDFFKQIKKEIEKRDTEPEQIIIKPKTNYSFSTDYLCDYLHNSEKLKNKEERKIYLENSKNIDVINNISNEEIKEEIKNEINDNLNELSRASLSENDIVISDKTIFKLNKEIEKNQEEDKIKPIVINNIKGGNKKNKLYELHNVDDELKIMIKNVLTTLTDQNINESDVSQIKRVYNRKNKRRARNNKS